MVDSEHEESDNDNPIEETTRSVKEKEPTNTEKGGKSFTNPKDWTANQYTHRARVSGAVDLNTSSNKSNSVSKKDDTKRDAEEAAKTSYLEQNEEVVLCVL